MSNSASYLTSAVRVPQVFSFAAQWNSTPQMRKGVSPGYKKQARKFLLAMVGIETGDADSYKKKKKEKSRVRQGQVVASALTCC